MIKIVHGVVHGKTIELDEELGVAEGQQVELQVRVLGAKKTLPGPPPDWVADGRSALAGAMASSWTAEDDEIFAQIARERRAETRRTTIE